MKRALILGAMCLGLSAAPSRPVAQNLGVAALPGSPVAALSSSQAEIVRLSNELTRIDTDASTLTPERSSSVSPTTTNTPGRIFRCSRGRPSVSIRPFTSA